MFIILTGSFNNFCLYFALLYIHEFGHSLTGLCLGYKIFKISFYPCGGISSFIMPLNVSLKKELLILLMGPIFQTLGYIIIKTITHSEVITIYHYSLLFFNLLPIYPLDGGRIINILFNYRISYLKSFYITYFISLFFLIILFIINIFSFNLNLFLMLLMLGYKLFISYKELGSNYNKFLLERYLYNYRFQKQAYINSIKTFFRDRHHFINFEDEKKYLQKHFVKR